MARVPGFTNSKNPKLSALRVADEPRFVALCVRVIEDKRGDVTAVARRLGMCRATVCVWIEHYPELRRAVDAGRKKEAERMARKKERQGGVR